MKNILLIFAAAVLMVGCGGNSDEKSKSKTVYVCMGSSATRYHKTDECPSLGNCKRGIEAMSVDEAEDMGRTPCRRCYNL